MIFNKASDKTREIKSNSQLDDNNDYFAKMLPA